MGKLKFHKQIVGKKLYDVSKCEILAYQDAYQNGAYAGTTYLLSAKDGKLLLYTTSNGQDFNRSTNLCEFHDYDYPIENFQTYFNAEKLAELGLLEIV